jgi:hypothetical protein
LIRRLDETGRIVLGLVAVAGLIILGLFVASAMNQQFYYLEQQRVRSPDGSLVAIFSLSSIKGIGFGATMAYDREIHIQRAGSPPLSKKTDREGFAFSDDSVDVGELRWLSPEKLLVVLQARPGYPDAKPHTVPVFDGVKKRSVTVDFEIRPRPS